MRVSITWSLEREQVIQVGRLFGIHTFEGERENFILNTFTNFKPVKSFENRSGVSELRGFNNGRSKGVLDLLEMMYLRLGKIVVQRVAVIKFGMYYGGCNDTGCFGVKIRMDATKLTNVRLALRLVSMKSCTQP